MSNLQTILPSETYRQRIEAAICEGKALGFPNPTTINPRKPVPDDQISILKKLIWNDWVPLQYGVLPSYWGNSCQTLSTNLYAWLVFKGIDADIVYGEVNVNTTLEFDTTLDGLRREYNSTNHEGSQELHAWVTIGDDIVLDPGLPDRLIKNYLYPKSMLPPVIIGRAGQLTPDYFPVQHIPMLVGTDFLAKTNSADPRELVEAMIASKAR